MPTIAKHRLCIGIGLLAGLLILGAPAAYAQGCSQCRTGAEAAGPEGGRAINLAILVLLLPTLGLFAGVLLFALRRRNTEADPAPAAPHPHTPAETVLHVSWLEHGR